MYGLKLVYLSVIIMSVQLLVAGFALSDGSYNPNSGRVVFEVSPVFVFAIIAVQLFALVSQTIILALYSRSVPKNQYNINAESSVDSTPPASGIKPNKTKSKLLFRGFGDRGLGKIAASLTDLSNKFDNIQDAKFALAILVSLVVSLVVYLVVVRDHYLKLEMPQDLFLLWDSSNECMEKKRTVLWNLLVIVFASLSFWPLAILLFWKYQACNDVVETTTPEEEEPVQNHAPVHTANVIDDENNDGIGADESVKTKKKFAVLSSESRRMTKTKSTRVGATHPSV